MLEENTKKTCSASTTTIGETIEIIRFLRVLVYFFYEEPGSRADF